MKKMSILYSSILGIFLMGSTMANSQSAGYQKPENIFNSDNSLDPGPDAIASNSATVSLKSKETFKKIFGDIPNVTWTKMDRNHDRAYFVNEGITVRAGFDKKGKLEYSFKYYTEEYLPKDVLFRIKNTYFGKTIFGITEVNFDGKTAYLVQLEDKSSWLKIKILDDEMTEEKVMLKR